MGFQVNELTYMSNQPSGYRRKLTDDELRQDLKSGFTQIQIAEKYGVSRAAISKRVKNLQVGTTAAVVAPHESRRFVSKNIDAIGELIGNLDCLHLLRDACEEWLRDDETGKYDIGARSSEVMITHIVEEITDSGNVKCRKEKDKLSELLYRIEQGGYEVDRSQTRFADPRELILKTLSEIRQTINAATELMQLLANIQSMERYRERFLQIIGEVSPEVRDALVEAIRRDLLLHPAFGGSERA